MVSKADPAACESFLQNAFARVPAAIAAIGLDGRVLECNPAYGEIVGVAIPDLIGTDAVAFVHPDDVEQAIASSVERIEGARTVDNRPDPIRILRSDGTTVWVQFDSSFIDDAPQPYVLATMTDVSAQVLAEAAHARSEDWYRSLVLHQSDIVTVVGFDGKILYISPNCERLLQLTDTEMVGTSGIENIHPDDIGALMDGISAQIEDGADTRPFEYRQRCRDGSWLWLEATARELPAEFGVEAVIVNARDVSERRRAAAAARAAEDRFRVAFAGSPLGIGFARLDGRLTWVNQALADIVGVPKDEMVKMHFQDFSTGDELAWEQHETLRLMAGEIDSFRVDKEYRHPDGQAVWARLHVSLMRGADGAPEQLLGQVEDITERKQLEMSLTHDAVHDSLTGSSQPRWAPRCSRRCLGGAHPSDADGRPVRRPRRFQARQRHARSRRRRRGARARRRTAACARFAPTTSWLGGVAMSSWCCARASTP